MTASTDKYISGTVIASKNSESLVTHPEEEGDTEFSEAIAVPDIDLYILAVIFFSLKVNHYRIYCCVITF